MPNPMYQKGVRFERKIVNDARAEGKIAFRTAGSKSIIDVCVIDMKNRTVRFIQAKDTKNSWKRLESDFKKLTDEYLVKFEVMEK